MAVGFYNDAQGHAHAYEVSQATGVFTAVKIPGDVSTTAAGINNNGPLLILLAACFWPPREWRS